LVGKGGFHVRRDPSGQGKDRHGRGTGPQDQGGRDSDHQRCRRFHAPDDTVTAISLFNNFAGAEEANRRALVWIEQNLEPLLAGPASAMAGPVIVHTLA
jgi:hypothetical protein